MKSITGLYIAFVLLQVITLVNITIFDGKWNGIGLALSTICFLAGSFFFMKGRGEVK